MSLSLAWWMRNWMIVSTGWKLEELLLGESSTHDEQYGVVLWKWVKEYQKIAYLVGGGDHSVTA